MDVPEKIILSQDKDTKELLDYWLLEDCTDNIKVEYVRTDIFIEKAAKFIRDNVELNKYKSSDEESYRMGCPYDYFETENFIRDFKDYMKKMAIVYIILIILLLSIVCHIFFHLMVVFHQDSTDICVKKVMEDPYKYVRDEEMCYFMRNMIYLLFVCMLLFAACNGNMKFEKTTNSIEINNMKNK